MFFKDRLRALRLEKDVTQGELAKYLGVGSTTVNGYEKGLIPNPPLDKLIKLSDYFSVSIDYLAARTSVRKPENDSRCDVSGRLLFLLDALSSDKECYYHGKLLTNADKELIKTLISSNIMTIDKLLK